jgi:CheY-like chemotaxis protein
VDCVILDLQLPGMTGVELLQRFEVLGLPLQLAKWINQRTQPRDFFDVSLRSFAIRPKIRRGHPRLQCA